MASALKKARKKPVRIKSAAAVARAVVMMERIYKDVHTALYAEQVMQSGNIVVFEQTDRLRNFAVSYNTISHSLMTSFAIALARLFDHGSKKFHRNMRDVASIPLIVHLLKQKRVQDALANTARQWIPHIPHLADSNEKTCREHIQKALAIYRSTMVSHQGRSALARLRAIRDHGFAHSLMNEPSKPAPFYNDLFYIADVAREFAEAAELAVLGNSRSCLEEGEMIRGEADAFWKEALTLPTEPFVR